MSVATQVTEPAAEPEEIDLNAGTEFAEAHPTRSHTLHVVYVQDDAHLRVTADTRYPEQAVTIDAFAPDHSLPTICLSAKAARSLIAQLNLLDLP